jgi:hypothetical protein
LQLDVGVTVPDAPGLCAPVGALMFNPSYQKPIGPYAEDCTEDQLEKLLTACFGSDATNDACTKWLTNDDNQTCLGCWAGSAKASPWAPVIYSTNGGEAIFVNVGGCIALADPLELQCAQATEFLLECQMQACVAYCPIPTTGSTKAADDALETCFTDAAKGACSMYADQAGTCEETLGPDSGTKSLAAFCYQSVTLPEALIEYLTLACGPYVDAGLPPPPPVDGGPGPTDAGKDGKSSEPDGH